MYSLNLMIMALIKCPECGKEISDKAKSCPQCGYPITKENSTRVESNLTPDTKNNFPDLPATIDIGSPCTEYGTDATIEGYFCQSENAVNMLKEGKVKIQLHPNGICLLQGLTTSVCISNQQIINVSSATQAKIISESKSVIGRAVVGGLLLGPVAAVIGGISGVGSKQKLVGNYYLVVNFWDVCTRMLQTLLISTKDAPVGFISRFEKEKQLQRTFTESENVVINILDDDLSLNKERTVKALKQVGKNKIILFLGGCKGRSIGTDGQALNSIISSEGLTKEDMKSSGCMLLLILMASISFSLMLVACSLI